MSARSWRGVGIAYASVVGDGTRRLLGWECEACGLVLGGPPIAAPPKSCPVCALREGRAPTFEARLSDAGGPSRGKDGGAR